MTESSQDHDVEFGLFDPTNEVWHDSRHLPHWFQPGVATFVTFRTADSMPREVIERWQKDQEEWLDRNGFDISLATDSKRLARLSPAKQNEFRRLRSRLWHRSLDNCHGECLFRQPDIASIVGEALLHFDGDRYDLDSFVVMPNHGHVLVQFRPPTTAKTQCESWLRFTARRINQHLGRSGQFWQSEPFDHLVRSPEQFEYLQRYIADNPKRANLCVGEYLYWQRQTKGS